MMKRYYRFAGLEFQVEMPEAIAYRDERHLASFRADTCEKPHVFRFDRVEELTLPAGNCQMMQPNFRIYCREEGHVRYIGGENPYIRAEHHGKFHTVQVKKNPYTDHIGSKTVLESMEIEHLTARNHGFIFHCSYIDHNGKAILFTAPSETGKSTQADLWAKYRGTEIINGDRAVLRLVDGMPRAEGIPFSGSSRYCENASLPIAAIVYLKQAPVTTIRRMRGIEAFSRIWEGVSVNTWEKQDLNRVSDTVGQIVSRVPVFEMPCTPDEQSVRVLEAALLERFPEHRNPGQAVHPAESL